MCTIGLISKSKQNTVTGIPNRFIDEFMVEANGTYVKVYLYLLRHLDDRLDFSVPEIAELLDCTENFLFKALNYWTKQGILEYTVSDDGNVDSINLVDLSGGSLSGSTAKPRRASAETFPEERPEPKAKVKKAVPVSPAEPEAMSEDENISFILTTLEQYFAHPLTRDDADTAVYIYETLGFSCDLLLFLYEKCIVRKKTNPKYICKVAIAWHEKGITTVEEAENDLLSSGEAYHAVCDEFGVEGSLGASQLRYLRTWVNEWHMPTALVREACSRAMLRKGASFHYANSILKSWHDAGAQTEADIEKLDLAHKQSEDDKHKVPAVKAAAQKPNRFDNFDQRQYSAETMAEIEKRMRSKR